MTTGEADMQEWAALGMLALYCLFALWTMYLISGPPLERWLRRRQPDISLNDLQRWRDWLAFLWGIVSLIFMIFWFVKYYAMYRARGPL